MTDEQIIAAILAGDKESFRLLIKRYESLVAATVYGILGSTSEAEDVGQETFVRFYQSLAKFRGEAKAGTYLTRIAVNLSLNALKRKKRYRTIFSAADESVLNVADSGAVKREFNGTLELIQNAIQKQL